VLYDPINIRYATGTRNMALWTQHSPDRYAFVPAEGPVILFDREAVRHQIKDFDTVDELRPAVRWYYEVTGPMVAEGAQSWADEISDLMR
jgi:Xaa-Pro aminopeptidase